MKSAPPKPDPKIEEELPPEEELDKELPPEVEELSDPEEVDELDDLEDPEESTAVPRTFPPKRPEMRINFDYKHQKPPQPGAEPMGDDEENTKMVENQVSTLDDLLEQAENDQKNEKKVEPEEPEEAVNEEQASAEDEPVHYEEETPIPRIKPQQRLSRNIGGDEEPLRYQPAHFPHDNFGQNPIYANQNAGPKPKKKGKLGYLLLLLVLGVLVVGGGVLVLKHKISLPFLTAKPIPTPEPTAIAESTPLPSPTPLAIDRSKYKIRILNGTGKAGLAASVAAQLKELGYQVDKTGNAPDTAQTTIKVKKDEEALLKQLIADLSKNYIATGTATLTGDDDGEVVLGLK